MVGLAKSIVVLRFGGSFIFKVSRACLKKMLKWVMEPKRSVANPTNQSFCRLKSKEIQAVSKVKSITVRIKNLKISQTPVRIKKRLPRLLR